MKLFRKDNQIHKFELSSLFPWYNFHESPNFTSRPKLHFSYQGQCQNISSNESRQAADKSNKKYVKEGIKNVMLLLEVVIRGMIDIILFPIFILVTWKVGLQIFITSWFIDYWHQKDTINRYVWLVNLGGKICRRTKIFIHIWRYCSYSTYWSQIKIWIWNSKF